MVSRRMCEPGVRSDGSGRGQQEAWRENLGTEMGTP